MRITIILILASMFSVKAEVVLSQNARVTLSKSESPLTEVLNEIENQTNYLFIINSNVDTKRKVSISAKNEKVSSVLTSLLTTTSIGYSMEGSYIILSHKDLAKEEEPTSTQQHHITGKVIDATGEPLLGVSILLTGSTVGVISDLDGNYAIDIPTNTGKLKFSYIGFKDVIVDIQQRTNINVTLKEDTELLGEVVVTAMGIKRKSNSLTYATQTVGGKDIAKVKDANFVNGLQGKSSGLTITPNSGGAGGASKLLLRGNKSITGNNSPLIVVDGIPMTNNLNGQLDVNGGGVSMDYNSTNEGADPLSTMNADDIESLTILKGANAAALYGSAASNGVIMITTKKGKEGKIRIDFSSSITFENI
ncbi:MAG: carboxypeptidase-like regulatory domain-containing protein, partial [Bacteroidaceae bacterium]